MDAVNLAAEQVARDERQISAGTLAPIELSAAKAELERRRDSLLTSITAITQTENQLKTLLLGDRSDPLWNLQLVPSDDQVPMPATQPAVGEAVAEAIRTRPELRDLNLQREANDEQLKLNRNQTRPQVNLTGTYSNQGLAGTAGSSANPFNDMFASLYGQINTISSQLGLPPVQPASFGAMPSSVLGDYGQAASSVFSGRYQSVQGGLQFQLTPRNRTAQSQLTQSLITGKRLDLLRRQTEQLIGVQVRNALQELESAEQRIRATEAAQQSARDQLESETRLFQNGQSTNFLVLTRQDEYLDARQRRVAAQADYNKALARYEQSVGSTLSAHDVKLQ
jgi:HAE1 family hydrophobic/amphiphilic exporter-1